MWPLRAAVGFSPAYSSGLRQSQDEGLRVAEGAEDVVELRDGTGVDVAVDVGGRDLDGCVGERQLRRGPRVHAAVEVEPVGVSDRIEGPGEPPGPAAALVVANDDRPVRRQSDAAEERHEGGPGRQLADRGALAADEFRRGDVHGAREVRLRVHVRSGHLHDEQILDPESLRKCLGGDGGRLRHVLSARPRCPMRK